MDIALVCEYLRNVGYDIPKPDRHLRRILGSDYLALSNEQTAAPFEAFDIIAKLAEITGKCNAEVDNNTLVLLCRQVWINLQKRT